MRILNTNLSKMNLSNNINNLPIRSDSNKYEKVQKKREYIDNKIGIISDLGFLSLISGFLLDGHNISFSKNVKNSTKQKFGFGLLCSAVALTFISLIKKIILANQYNDEREGK